MKENLFLVLVCKLWHLKHSRDWLANTSVSKSLLQFVFDICVWFNIFFSLNFKQYSVHRTKITVLHMQGNACLAINHPYMVHMEWVKFLQKIVNNTQLIELASSKSDLKCHLVGGGGGVGAKGHMSEVRRISLNFSVHNSNKVTCSGFTTFAVKVDV